MATLHIRDISDKLMQRLKSDAALNGQTLREYVVMQLGGEGGGGNHRAEGAARAGKVSHSERGAGASRGASASRKCLCGDSYERHANGGVCQARQCECRKFEEG